MKKFIIAALLILAAIFPILFLPLLALTVVIIFFVIPYFAKHGVWGQDKSTTNDLNHAA